MSKAPIMIPAHLIAAKGINPRKSFNDEKLNNLAASIKEHGLFQNLVVRPDVENEAGYELIAGERRFRAGEIAGLTEYPCIVLHVADREALTIALAENEERESLDPIEKARAYERLKELGFTQREIAAAEGKKQAAISNAKRLLELPEKVQDLISAGRLKPSHGEALLRWKDRPELVEALAQIVALNGIAVAEVEKPGFLSREDVVAALVERGIVDIPNAGSMSRVPTTPPTVTVPEQTSTEVEAATASEDGDGAPTSAQPNTIVDDEIREVEAGAGADADAEPVADVDTEVGVSIPELPLKEPSVEAVTMPPHVEAVHRSYEDVSTSSNLMRDLEKAKRIIAYLVRLQGGSVTVPRVVFVDDNVTLTSENDVNALGVQLTVGKRWADNAYRDASAALDYARKALPADTPSSYFQAINRTVNWLSSKTGDGSNHSTGNIPEPDGPSGKTITVDREWIDQLSAHNSAKEITSGKSLPVVKAVRFRNNKLYCVVAINRRGMPLMPYQVDAYELAEPDAATYPDEPVVFNVMRDDPFEGVHVRVGDHVMELIGPRVSFVQEGE